MNRYESTDQQTDLVYSSDWGYGRVEQRYGNCIRVLFKDKWREIDFKYYQHKGKITYIIPTRSSVKYLMERNVKYLVHFTPIENLKSILTEGIIPRDLQKTPGLWTDTLRLDGHTDCSCFSVSYPNYSMLYQKRKNREKSDVDGMDKFALLMVYPSALHEIDDNNIAYYQNNAASCNHIKNSFHDHTGIVALQNMFSDRVSDAEHTICRENQFLSSEYTTHPQAEILIRGTIPSQYIKKIILPDYNAKKYLPSNIPEAIKVEFDEEMFWPEPNGKWAEYESKRRGKSNGYQTCFYRGRYQAVC